MAKTAKQYLDCEARLESERAYWKNIWQLTAEYVHQRRADFTVSRQPGAFISPHLWTDDPTHMAETASSAFLGYVWSAGPKSFKLTGNPKLFGKNRKMKEFWADATEGLQEEMADQEAGLATALDEAMLDLISLGTASVFTEERNVDQPTQGALLFEPRSIQQGSIDENAAGRADMFYTRREYTARQMVEKYSYEKVSKKAKAKIPRDHSR